MKGSSTLEELKENKTELEMFTQYLKRDSHEENLQCYDKLEQLKSLTQQILWSNPDYVKLSQDIHSRYFTCQNTLGLQMSTVSYVSEKYNSKDPYAFCEVERELYHLVTNQLSIFHISNEWRQYKQEKGANTIESNPIIKELALTPEELNFVNCDKTVVDRKLEKKPSTSAIVEKLKVLRKKSSLQFSSMSPTMSPLSKSDDLDKNSYEGSPNSNPLESPLASVSSSPDNRLLDSGEVTPKRILEVIKSGDVDLVTSMIDKSIDINLKCYSERGTYLHCAVISGHAKIVELLISKGAQVDALDQHGRTPSHFAASAGKRDVILTLLGNGARITIRDSYGYSPFLLCLKAHHFDLVPDFLLFGADYNYKRDNGMTALHEAMHNADQDLVKFLLKQGSAVKLNPKDQYGQTPLHKGCEKAPATMLYNFMKTDGIDPFAIDDQGRNIFHLCAAYQRDDFFSLLETLEPLALSKYVKMMNASDYVRSMSPLHVAVETAKLQVVKSLTALLVRLNVDLNVLDTSDSTPFVFASKLTERGVLEFRPIENRTPELKEKVGEMLKIKQFLVNYDKQPKIKKKKK